jgi:hypothetical protein
MALAAAADMPTATVIGELDFMESGEKHHSHTSIHEKGAHAHIKQWPESLRSQLVRTFKQEAKIKNGSAFLQGYKWPEGLKGTVYKSCKKIPLRFIIIDDSGEFFGSAMRACARPCPDAHTSLTQHATT